MDLDATVERAAARHVDAGGRRLHRPEQVRRRPASTSCSRRTCSSTSSARTPRPPLADARRVLRPGGRLILHAAELPAQPGSVLRRLHPRGDLHRPVAARLPRLARAWTIERVRARFLPLTLKSRGSRLTFLVPWYLRSPIKPLAGQMLVVASRRPAEREVASMWNGKTLSVVLPTYNEKDSIADVIDGSRRSAIVDEIIVVNNNAAAGTSEEVAKTGAREVIETTQGYGAAIKRGLREADDRPRRDLRARRHVQPGRPAQAAGVHAGVRLRRRLAHRVELHLGRRQHGLVPAVGQLGGRQVDRGPLQHVLPQRRRLHVPGHDRASRPR